MPNFNKHDDVLETLKDVQDADHDNREKARETWLFVNKRDGQWEPYWWNINDGRPRYTFDMVNPVIDQIAGEMEQADFDIRVSPAGGDATKELSKTLDGLIRNIENISNAKHVFNSAGRSMITMGLDGWRVTTKFVNSDSFDQDLVIEKISNFQDRVWFDTGSEMQDRSDAQFCYVLQALPCDEYDKRFPKGSRQSVTLDSQSEAFFHKGDFVIVGEILWKKPREIQIVLMSDGRVYEVNADFEQIRDEKAAIGIVEQRRRTIKKDIVFSRLFDNDDFLEPAKETVFSWLPVIPTYGNFSIFENKTVYWGVVERLLDYQRVFNYAKSREIEEGALAPRSKYWMTAKQAEGYSQTLRTMNTNADPVQFFNPDPENPGPPQQNGGAVVNPGLLTISESMQDGIARAAGLFAANMGEQVNSQSGVAIKALQQKGSTGTIKYFKSQEIAICHTAKILIDAIPKIYDTERQIRVLGEDGATSMVVVNERVMDQQTGEVITLNDLNQGLYDVTCTSGPSFANRQAESVQAFNEMAAIDPTIIEMGGDILFNNLDAPGMDLLAERKRQQLLQAGIIPFDQMTEEEQQAAQQAAQEAAQNPPEPDPAQMIAQAEIQKSEADLITAQNRQTQSQIDLQEAAAKLQLQSQEQNRRDTETGAKIEDMQIKQDLAVQQAQLAQVIAITQADAKEREVMRADLVAALDSVRMNADILKTIREAMGVDAIVGPHNQAAYVNQAQNLNDSVTAAGDVAKDPVVRQE